MARWLAWAGVAATAAALSAQGGSGTLDSLVKAERAFARMSVATSQRDAFLANFADDGVWFTPGPQNTREAIRRQPAPAGPPARTLDWEPAIGDIAASGDLGYTTGPYVSTPRAADAPPRTGWFFSVWRWRPDTRWKVAADFGIEAPASAALRPRTFRRADVRAFKLRVTPGPEGARGGTPRGGRRVCRARQRPRVPDGVPRAGDTGRAGLSARRRAARGQGRGGVGHAVRPVAVHAGADACRGVAGGRPRVHVRRLHRGRRAAGRSRAAYYLHVWKRLADGWKLAADVTNRVTALGLRLATFGSRRRGSSARADPGHEPSHERRAVRPRRDRVL